MLNNKHVDTTKVKNPGLLWHAQPNAYCWKIWKIPNAINGVATKFVNSESMNKQTEPIITSASEKATCIQGMLFTKQK